LLPFDVTLTHKIVLGLAFFGGMAQALTVFRRRALAERMSIRAALFDIDGTLVDSNYLHVDAWVRAFEEVERPVDAWRIHRAIGMDGEKLLDALIGGADHATRKRVTDLHAKYYLPMASQLRPFDHARELLRTLTDRGVTVVLATSAPEPELKNLRSTLEIEDAVDVVTSSEDVETATPSPDIVAVALERAGVEPHEAVMIGDTVWDVAAAQQAGVACIGVLSGGISVDELRDAGAAAVYSDVADLLEHLDDSLLG
jgi:HAD superfamily hydrolase (TIGR01509 family)